ncbi:MAG TPA: glycerol-3-phosphate 1-O-acyltransferase PlsY [Gammaproteobacteria bacterium]|nr:glycerol-3-phosphate 1-O-acyltransferase PlsY [Gammaproteobacteria bacterium]
MIEIIALLILAYLLGSISSAILLSKIMGFKDPRSEGSKNPGATNVLRIAGKKAAFLTLVGDCLKGFIPVLVAARLFDEPMIVALAAFATFAGHCFPIFFAFRGGKGVATAIAATVAFNWMVGAILIAIWLLFARVFKISSLAAIISFCALPALVYWQVPDFKVTSVFAVISIILIWRHRANIERLLKGKEA